MKFPTNIDPTAGEPATPAGEEIFPVVFLFSSPDQRKAAEAAEAQTGLRAREIFVPGSEPPDGSDGDWLRCQLGEVVTELRRQSAVKGICAAYEGKVEVFELIAFGPTWPAAVAAFRRRARR